VLEAVALGCGAGRPNTETMPEPFFTRRQVAAANLDGTDWPPHRDLDHAGHCLRVAAPVLVIEAGDLAAEARYP
jgi:hypothetical protein